MRGTEIRHHGLPEPAQRDQEISGKGKPSAIGRDGKRDIKIREKSQGNRPGLNLVHRILRLDTVHYRKHGKVLPA
jgi:hypothetical protein